MNHERLMMYKELSHKRMMENKEKCDFDVERHIERFNQLEAGAQRMYIRSWMRSRFGRHNKPMHRRNIKQRLEDHKSGKEFMKMFMEA